MLKTAVVLLAGGTGSRIPSSIPKQFLLLKNKPIALHSFDIFSSMLEINEIVVVCADEYQHYFSSQNQSKIDQTKITFAKPGNRRQDSVFNGLMAITTHPNLVCVHDSARPLIDVPLVQRVLTAAKESGAAAVGMPLKYTVKQCNALGLVINTPDRTSLWEIQTPQVIEFSLLHRAFLHAQEHSLDVTDDVSLIEQLGLPVQIVQGSYRNIKITTPEDLTIANAFENLERQVLFAD